MFKMILSTLLVLSIGWADAKKDKTIIKKKMVVTASNDEKEDKNVNVEVNIDDNTMNLLITVNGDEKEFEIPLNNQEAMESLVKEIEEMGLDINIAQFMGKTDMNVEDHVFMKSMQCDDQENRDGYLGVQIQGLDGQLADYFGAKNGGVLVTEVIENSPADKAGMKAGDVILSVAEELIDDASDLVEEIQGHEPNSKIELKVIRKNRKRKMKVTLGEAPQSFDMGFNSGKKMMFFGNNPERNEEDVDVFFNVDHDDQPIKKAHHMMKRLQSHDENEKIDEFKIQLNILKNEMKKLQADMKNLKKDS